MNNPMYTIIKSRIEAGGFKLADMIRRIREEQWHDTITEAERDELIELANQAANPEAERPEVLDMIKALSERVARLEQAQASKEEPGEDSGEPSYPEWKFWDGVSKDYQKGAVVIHNGSIWESVFEGQNTWEPGVVDERFWVKRNA